MIIIPLIVLLISSLIVYRRVRLHNLNIQNVIITPEQEIIQPTIADIEWHVNTAPIRMQIIGIIALIIGVIITIPLYQYQIIVINYSQDLCLSGVALMLIYMWGAIFLWAPLRTPIKIGFSEQGIHLQYRSESRAKNSLTFVKWDDIQEANPMTMFNETSFTLKLKNDKMEYIGSVNINLANMIMERFEKIKGKKIKMKTLKKDQKIQWFENGYVKRHKLYGSILLFIGVSLITFSVYIAFRFGTDSDNLFFLLMMAILPITFGVSEIVFSRKAPTQVGFSKVGFHVTYLEKKPKDKFEFLAWDEIKEINPPFSRMVDFIKKNGLIQKLDFVTPEIFNKILFFFEEYKPKIEKPSHQKTLPQNVQIEWLENYYAYKVKMILFVPIISIVLLTLILIFLSLGLNLFSPVYLTLLIMVVLIPIALLRYYFEYSYAPIQVGFSELGFLVKYREKNQNPMLLDYVWWDDIADVKELEELDSFRTGDIFKKGEKQKYIVILKKSGINKVLGPIDIELADKIKSRAGK